MNVKFFNLAGKVARLSNNPKFKLGCVIVRGSKVISVGTNNIKTHPRSTHPFKSLHAEMDFSFIKIRWFKNQNEFWKELV